MNIIQLIESPNFLIAVLAAVSAAAAVITFGAQFFEKSDLNKRIKSVAVERERLRAEQLQRIRTKGEADRDVRGLRARESSDFLKNLVERLSLRKAFMDDQTPMKLAQAGYRGPRYVTIYLFMRFVTPIALFGLSFPYFAYVIFFDRPLYLNALYALTLGLAGAYLPNLLLKNQIIKRQSSIRRSWPDALDLMLLCVEAGMSIEHAIKRVAREIGLQSEELAEELELTTAELSFLEDRGKAYENLADRTGLDGVRAVMTALIQADRYGTSVGQSLRVMAEEGREQRMMEAEKKAAALPPKLTVPLIVFFLPVLFIVIMAPALIRVFARGVSFG
ncbi:MAG: type II secretion system F family protein [Hyphomicrobiaceae bacterium]|nr:type II secretion system F family protein [Hyphomicrobiaceae bacterium]